MRLRWVFTDLPFLPLGTQTVINNRVWNDDQTSDLEVGQLPLVESDYRQDARWALLGGLNGEHQCNPQWFAVGEPWPNDLPPSRYSRDRIPVCCGRPTVPTEGGLGMAGAVGDVFGMFDATAGGLALKTVTADTAAGVDPTAGGLVVGGLVVDTLTATDAPAGGLVVGGAAGDVFVPNIAPAGGLVLGGAVADVLQGADQSAGGVAMGGEVGDVHRRQTVTAGGLVIGGAVGDFIGAADAPAGGMTVGGAAGDRRWPTSFLVGTPTPVTVTPLSGDTVWQHSGGGVTTRMWAPGFGGVGDQWLIRLIQTGTDPLYYAPSSWNGLGSQWFTPDPANPLGYTDVITVSQVM